MPIPLIAMAAMQGASMLNQEDQARKNKNYMVRPSRGASVNSQASGGNDVGNILALGQMAGNYANQNKASQPNNMSAVNRLLDQQSQQQQLMTSNQYLQQSNPELHKELGPLLTEAQQRINRTNRGATGSY